MDHHSTLDQMLRALLLQRQALDQQIEAIQKALMVTPAVTSDRPGPAVNISPAMIGPTMTTHDRHPGGRPRKNYICTIPGCGQEHVAKGLCAVHYARERRRSESARLTQAKPSLS